MPQRVPASQLAPLSELESEPAPLPVAKPAPRPSLARSLARFLEAKRVERMLRRTTSQDAHPYRAPTERDEMGNERLAAHMELRSAFLHRLGTVACFAAVLTLVAVVAVRGARQPAAPPPDMKLALHEAAAGFTAANARPRVRFGIQPRAMAVDINRDGTRDFFVYGEVEDTPPLGFYSVLDGKTLAPIWATTPLPHDRHPLPIVAAGKRVFFADNAGRLRIHDLATGALISDVQTDPGWDVCRRADDASVWIATVNEHIPRGIVVDTSGRVVETTPRPPGCADAWRAHDIPDRGPDKRLWRMFETDDHVFGFGIDILGAKSIETVVMFNPKGRGGHRWTERYYLGGDEGPSIDVQGYEVDPYQFYFAYRLTDGSRRIGARSLFAGNIAWATTSTRHPGAIVQGMTSGDDLLVVAETHAELFSKETGKTLRFLRARDALRP